MESSYQKAYKIFKFIDENVINDLNLRYKESCAQIKIFVTELYADFNSNTYSTYTFVNRTLFSVSVFLHSFSTPHFKFILILVV